MRTSKETNNSSAELIAIIKEMLEQEPDLESLLGLPFVEGDRQSISSRGLVKELYTLLMSMTALDMSPEELKKYRPLDAIKKRRAKFRAEITSRRRHAVIATHKAAKLLKTEIGAKRGHPVRIPGAAEKFLPLLRY